MHCWLISGLVLMIRLSNVQGEGEEETWRSPGRLEPVHYYYVEK